MTTIQQQPHHPAIAALLGLAVGDALGVPYEFVSREKLRESPAVGMIGYGTHNQPAGTWSDDAALTFCLAESLLGGYDLRDMAAKFVAWFDQGYWSAHGKVFDIGNTTLQSIRHLDELLSNTEGSDAFQQLTRIENEYENGNGSLMRILPLLFYLKGWPLQQQFERIHEISALTHRHSRAAMSCLIYLRLAEHLLNGKEKISAYHQMREEIMAFWEEISWPEDECAHFERIIGQNILETDPEILEASGYVIATLEAVLYFFLRENNYKDTVLHLVNLGFDTDTVAAIGGGLAGLHYGLSDIPEDWLAAIARRDDIETLGRRLGEKYP